MPRVVEYAEVLSAMQALNLRSLYYNSGAFGFETGVEIKSTGWICTEDPSLRPEARELARMIPGAPEVELANLLARAATELFPGPVWVMPKSHWAFELDFGSPAWMPEALRNIGIDPTVLKPRTTGDAIEFTSVEISHFTRFATQLLTNLMGSDFAVAFPGRPVICTLHHHKQIWWTTTDGSTLRSLEQLAS